MAPPPPPPRQKCWFLFLSACSTEKWGPFYRLGGGLSAQNVSAPTNTHASPPPPPENPSYATVLDPLLKHFVKRRNRLSEGCFWIIINRSSSKIYHIGHSKNTWTKCIQNELCGESFLLNFNALIYMKSLNAKPIYQFLPIWDICD